MHMVRDPYAVEKRSIAIVREVQQRAIDVRVDSQEQGKQRSEDQRDAKASSGKQMRNMKRGHRVKGRNWSGPCLDIGSY